MKASQEKHFWTEEEKQDLLDAISKGYKNLSEVFRNHAAKYGRKYAAVQVKWYGQKSYNVTKSGEKRYYRIGGLCKKQLCFIGVGSEEGLPNRKIVTKDHKFTPTQLHRDVFEGLRGMVWQVNSTM